MTIDIGEGAAKEIGDNHENGEKDSEPANEYNMDTSNNAFGRNVGKHAAGGNNDAKKQSALHTCQNAANQGQLVTLT